MHSCKIVIGALVLGLAACGDPDDGRNSGTANTLGTLGSDATGEPSSGPGSSDPSADDGSDAGSDDSADGVDSGPIFDVGGNTSGALPEEGCQAVDFLFVIDSSVSMEGEQANLVAAFPGFMNAITTTLEAGSDFHIMVADTDEWGRCNTVNGWPAHDPSHDTCNNYVETTMFDECDRVLGAGVVHPAGDFASNQLCTPFGGNRYIIEGEPNLDATFACMATVGTAGHPAERPMDAMVAALQPAINGPGGCNDGFLRDDALLVVTFISDDPNYEDANTPTDWYNSVVAAKNGDPAGVVVLGLTPAWMGCQSGKGPPKGDHWVEFLDLWGVQGLHGNVCSTAADYVMFFEQAVDDIDQACDNFNPPG